MLLYKFTAMNIDNAKIVIKYNSSMNCSLDEFKEIFMYNEDISLYEFLEHVNDDEEVHKTLSDKFWNKYEFVGFPEISKKEIKVLKRFDCNWIDEI